MSKIIDNTINDHSDADLIKDISFLNSDKYILYSNNENFKNLNNKIKECFPFITKFEKAKIIALRAEMIANGAIPLIDIPSYMISSIDIATLEYLEKKIPLIIRRYHSDKTYEDWRLQDMIDINK